ncbi:hypothetical protein FSP39_004491 [Pinctada imbricata]|uniref:EF-hand domain-containing protein n=1 Tax=Pinctada imbricata TaxID=66713 RepID=A0AA88XL51_PINIB|nr:hypothetical protein FSP39_004491 [Pinctada imbricata]
MPILYFTELYRAYRLLDSNGNNKVSADEIMRGAQLIGINPTREEAKQMVKDCDTDADGYLGYEEFEAVMKKHILMVEYQTSMLENAFKHFDKDKSGYLDREQLSNALRNYGDKFTPEEEEEFFRLADADQNGEISKAGILLKEIFFLFFGQCEIELL